VTYDGDLIVHKMAPPVLCLSATQEALLFVSARTRLAPDPRRVSLHGKKSCGILALV
jgi:hypothetical protein